MDEVEKLIIDLAHTNWITRWHASSSLGEIGDNRAVPALIETLKDIDYTVRSYAAQALGKMSDKRAIPALMKVLNDEYPDVRMNAAKALEMIGYVHLSVNYKVQCLLIKEEFNELVALRKDAVPGLINLFNQEDPRVRQNAAWLLGLIGDPSAVPVLIGVLQDEIHNVQIKAGDALYAILEYCKTTEEISDFEKRLEEGYDVARKKHRKEDLTDVRLLIAKLKIQISKRRNELSKDKGILLDDKPKPPQKCKMYSTTRKACV
jgi:HEAT repeat protein